MKVHELIAMLQTCDHDAEVRFAYDYDGDNVEEEVNFVSQTVLFGAGDEGDDVIFVTLSH